MRKRNLKVLIVLLAGVGILWWLVPPKTKNATLESPVPGLSNFRKRGDIKVAQASQNETMQTQAVSSARPNVPADVLEFVRRTREDPTYEWRQPINFYGKVVEENGEAVSGATVDFKWNDLSPDGTSTVQSTSDSNGFFSLVNRTGKYLTVQVNKDGYYTSRRTPIGFEYAYPEGKSIPDATRPIIFYLRKKGKGVNFVTSDYGMRTDFQVSIPRDGTPLNIDLMNRKTGSAGQMQVSQLKPEYVMWKQATAWSFRMEIPDGGFVEQNDEFPFEAPEIDYQRVVESKFAKENPGWAERIKRKYYIKFGTPPRYGRLEIETGISYGGAILTYAINPDGSRNLEPK